MPPTTAQQVTDEYLERDQVPVLSDIDTRALVRHLRERGVMRGVISTLEMDVEKLVAMAKATPTIDGWIWQQGQHAPVRIEWVEERLLPA